MARQTWLAVAGLVLILQGCNCFGREFTKTLTFDVHATAEDPLCSKDFTEIDLGSDQAFQNVRQFVARFELRKLRVAVNDPKTREDSIAKLAHGSVQVAASQTSTTFTLGTYEAVEIKAGNGQDIAIDKAAQKELAKLALTSPNKFFIAAEGCNDAVPAFYTFDVTMTFYAGL